MDNDQQAKVNIVRNLQAGYERDMQRLREISAKLAFVLANTENNA